MLFSLLDFARERRPLQGLAGFVLCVMAALWGSAPGLGSEQAEPIRPIAVRDLDATGRKLLQAQQALYVDSTAVAAHYLLGTHYFEIGNFVAARNHLGLFLEGADPGPDSLRGAYLEARTLIEMGLRLRATRAMKRVARNPQAPGEAWHDLSLLLYQDRLLPEAAMAEMRALELVESRDSVFREAAIQWKRLQRPDQSLQLLAGVLDGRGAIGEDFFQNGLMSHRIGRYEMAMRSYEEALALDATHPEAHYNLSLIAERDGDSPRAIRHVQEVLRLRPNYEPAYFQLGKLFLSERQPGEARDVFRRFIEISADSLAIDQAQQLIDDIDEQFAN